MPKKNLQTMTMQYHNTRSSARLITRTLLSCMGLSLLAGACNSDSEEAEQTGYVEPTDVAVTAFSLKTDTKVLTGLDSVYFSIDLQRGLIYNADSLPKGTRVTDLIPVISYSNYISSAVIKMEGGQKRSGEVDYKSNPNDSIDFTGNVTLTLTSGSGNFRTYNLKVNVHESEPDSLCWGQTAVSKLPARTAAPQEQRTVLYKEQAVTLIKEQDGSYTLSTCPDPATAQWTQTPIQPDFTPRVRTLAATSGKLWLLDTEGRLYSSAAGVEWQAADKVWHNIIGAYGETLLGIARDDNGAYTIESANGLYPAHSLPDGFPIEDYSNIYSYKSKWMAAPVSVIAGGVTASGTLSSAVWAFDGLNWAKLSTGRIPALRSAVLVPYYTFRRKQNSWSYNEFSTVMMLGGMDGKGELNRKTYITYDNGVNWTEASSLLCLPEQIPGMWQIDQTIQSKPMQAPLLAPAWEEAPARRIPAWYRVASSVENNTISWECPYIYLYGGCDSEGMLYNTIWRGVLNRLLFKPII